jgi:hypothetical protein
MDDQGKADDRVTGALTAAAPVADQSGVTGTYTATCTDTEGQVLWQQEFDNLVTNVGKALVLDQSLAGSSYTATEYMGLISSTSFSAVAAADTMSSHAGWLESGGANAPTMSSTRQTCAWSAAAGSGTVSKALSAGLAFVFTGSGTVQGAFLVGGASASATVANTGGTLISAGTLAVAQPVINGNTLTVSYTAQLT